jgi:hypothetical protein
MSVEPTIRIENGSGWVRRAAATVIGMLLVPGGFIGLGWIDEACSDSVARCNWAIPSIPFAFAAIFGCTFVMARICSKVRWGARGALALPFLLVVMNAVQELIDAVLARPPAIPPFPGVTAIVVGAGAAAAVTLPSAGLGFRMTRLASTLAVSGVPALLLAAFLGDDGPLTASIALIGVGLAPVLLPARPRTPDRRTEP